MTKLLPPTIAMLAGCVISFGTAHGADSKDAQPCSAANVSNTHGPFVPQFFLPDQQRKPAKPTTTVHSFSTQGCAGAVLKGERGTARIGGDTIELKDGTVYVNGVSYGAVTPTKTVEYDVTRDKRTLVVDGKIRSPAC
ncbi:S26 family signal peptidase [Caballeronia sp. SEWSISQ10-4 2]|uniref:sugar ABC transporter ATPase n=1 Tax=Caballeronia sp. SEWSISQ10-4 2 TaxID=2937438 RepID=UPI00264AFF01|nr:sugar ABC transporter ATPase [Caballeronia sp. SEWSISQ10-4 2]MDN7184698.1 S26 family signal peptidase [Caballeronia sp. SEWSISQ10-4 2]